MSNHAAKLHGRVAYYDEVIGMINRNDFLDINLYNRVSNEIKNNVATGLAFLPTPLHETHLSEEERGVHKYKIILGGVLLDGRKVYVMLNEIYPSVCVRLVSNDDIPRQLDELKSDITDNLPDEKEYPVTKMKTFQAKPYKLYRKAPCTYVQLEFNKLKERRMVIDILKECDYQLSRNDLSSYYKVVCRNYGTTFSSWVFLKNYRIISHDYVKGSNNPKDTLLLSLNINDYHKVDSPLTDEMISDKTVTMTWDIEAFSPDGTLPNPNVREHCVFMISMTFQFASSKKSFFRVCLVTTDCDPKPKYLTIVCKDECNMLKNFANIVSKMKPEIIHGFNDTNFDWQWIMYRASQYNGVLSYMARKISPFVPFHKYSNDADILKFNFRKFSAKINAEQSADGMNPRFEGYIPIDVRVCFQKIFLTKENSSLNWYLKKLKLGGKKDMPISKLFRTYRELSHLMTQKDALLKHMEKLSPSELNKLKLTSYERHKKVSEQKSFVMTNAEEKDSMKVDNEDTVRDEFSRDVVLDRNINERVGSYLRLKEEMSQVAEYCVIDSFKCHMLMKSRSVLNDHREIASMAYVGLIDAFYQANGNKVINLMIATGQQAPFNLEFDTTPSSAPKYKFPGAHVFDPETGLKIPKLTIRERIVRAALLTEKRQLPFDQNNPKKYIQEREDLLKKHNIQREGPFKVAKKKEVIVDSDIEEEEEEKETPLYYNARCNLVKNPSINHYIDTSDVDLQKYLQLTDTDVKFYETFIKLHGSCMKEDEFDNIDEYYRKLLSQCKDSSYLASSEDEQHIIEYLTTHKNTSSYHVLPELLRKFLLEKIERPITGLDFSSLYPSIIMNDNLSPEKLIVEQSVADRMMTEHKLKHVQYRDEHGREQNAWFIWHDNKTDITKPDFKFGLYPYILLNLFNQRAAVKKILNELKDEAEHINLKRSKGEPFDPQRLEMIKMMESYVNSKQTAMKVFMNTFYGLLGTSSACIYTLSLAIAVTSAGRENIHFVKSVIENNNNRIAYGDTDSAYVALNDKFYKSIDDLYYSGRMEKKDYMEKMVEISIKEIENLKNTVNNELSKKHNAKFLKVAYEEVLYPVIFMAKKKYFGIPHIGVVNYMVDELFIRGLDLKKRGVSNLLRIICTEILWRVCNIYNVYTIMEIVQDKIDEAYMRTWDYRDFYQTSVLKRGVKNVKITTFAARMLEQGIKIVENERFNFVITKKVPFRHDYRGRTIKLSVGDKIELAEIAYKDQLEIDIDYYMSRGVNGQLARFLSYHHIFRNGLSRPDDTAEIIASNEVKIFKLAYKFVEHYCNQYYSTYLNKGPIYQSIFRKTSKLFKENLNNKDLGTLLVANVNTKKLEDDWVKKAEKEAMNKLKKYNYGKMTMDKRLEGLSKELRKFKIEAYYKFYFVSGSKDQKKGYIIQFTQQYQLKKEMLKCSIVNRSRQFDQLYTMINNVLSDVAAPFKAEVEKKVEQKLSEMKEIEVKADNTELDEAVEEYLKNVDAKMSTESHEYNDVEDDDDGNDDCSEVKHNNTDIGEIKEEVDDDLEDLGDGRIVIDEKIKALNKLKIDACRKELDKIDDDQLRAAMKDKIKELTSRKDFIECTMALMKLYRGLVENELVFRKEESKATYIKLLHAKESKIRIEVSNESLSKLKQNKSSLMQQVESDIANDHELMKSF